MIVPPLRPYQAEVVRAVIDSVRHQRGLTFTVMVARQGGKNELSAQLELALLLLARGSGGEQIKAAPTFDPQCLVSLRRLWSVCQAAKLDRIPKPARIFANGVRLGLATQKFLSAEPRASVVGHTASRLLECDEAQDVDPEKFDKDFRPMGATTNVTTIFYGTAWTEDSLLASMRDRCAVQERSDGIRRNFTADWSAVARHNPAYAAYVEGERDRLGESHPLFQTQYLLRTLPGAGRLLSPQALDLLRGRHPLQHGPNQREQIVAGLDVGAEALQQSGRDPDRTVLTLASVSLPTQSSITREPTIRVARIYSWQGDGHPVIAPAVLQLLARWGVRRLVIDATGVGEGLAATIAARAQNVAVERLRLNERSKSDLGFLLQAAAGSGRLMLPDCEDEDVRRAADELKTLRSELRPNQLLHWGNAEPLHDDHAVSLALCVWAAGSALPIARGRTGQDAR